MFGLSTQDTVYQLEAAERLHLPFPLLSDDKLSLTQALGLPTMQVAGITLIKRLALIIEDAVIAKVFYPSSRRTGTRETSTPGSTSTAADE